jgi:anti-anti-sigma factor
MANMNFSAQVRGQPGLAVIDLFGEINAFVEKALSHAFDEAEQAHPAAIALNFTGVTYINSTGIALIVGLLARARQAQRSLSVWGLSDHYTEIFQITRLADFISIHPDEASAVQAVLRNGSGGMK